jgi:hypothetical protein
MSKKYTKNAPKSFSERIFLKKQQGISVLKKSQKD